ncbi:Nischarin, partial [Armadillidium nasatum]
MSSLSENDNLEVSIPDIETLDKVTHYNIMVQLGKYSWKVTHRYSEFADLHDLLVSLHGLASDLLPPKKIIGNKDPMFIEKRKKDLELYLQTVVSFMSVAIPEQLSEFLELKYYEINFLLQDMAKFFYSEGDRILQDNKFTEFNPLQLLAISKQMQSPNPVGFAHQKEADFANIVDFCSGVKRIIIKGSSGLYRSSNMKMNDLEFNLIVFKNVEEINIIGASLNKIEKLGPVRGNIKRLKVQNSDIEALSEIVVCDSLYKEIEESMEEYVWTNLEELDLSFNSIEVIDNSVVLTPKLKFLNLKGNKLKNI